MISNTIIIQLITSFLLALGLSLYSTRIVVNSVKKLNLFDCPNERSATKQPIPTLGGIAIFFSFIFATTIGLFGVDLGEWAYIVAATLLIFFIGLKDDILTLSPFKKIMGQIIAACIIIFFAKIRFTDLHGLFGIGEIGMIPSFLITGFTIIVIINAFNLMDGIDGLAAGLSILVTMVFGTWFLISGHLAYAILCVSLVGALGGFFYFNVYGKQYKIFMGDTGSLVLGTIISIFVIRFNEFNIDQTQPYSIASVPVISFGILSHPLIDTVRVMVIRILNHRSPFSADKNHFHHRLLTLGFSHRKATFTIVGMNALFIILIITLHHIGILRLAAYIAISSSILIMIPAYIIRKKHLIKKDDPFQQLLIPGSVPDEAIKPKSFLPNRNEQKHVHKSLKHPAFSHRFNFW